MQKILTVLIFIFIAGQGIAQNVNSKQVSDSLPKKVSIDSVIFNKVEIEAEFPSGNLGWREYLMKNLKANVPVKRKAPAGTYMVVVRFIVNINGSIRDVKAETSFGYGMEEEVIRIIKKGPKWTPASVNGKHVNAYRRQPVTFAVVED